MSLILCRCGAPLCAENNDGSFEARYRKRTIVFWPPARITCQSCGFTKPIDGPRPGDVVVDKMEAKA
jgi:hypothetical protein